MSISLCQTIPLAHRKCSAETTLVPPALHCISRSLSHFAPQVRCVFLVFGPIYSFCFTEQSGISLVFVRLASSLASVAENYWGFSTLISHACTLCYRWWCCFSQSCACILGGTYRCQFWAFLCLSLIACTGGLQNYWIEQTQAVSVNHQEVKRWTSCGRYQTY